MPSHYAHYRFGAAAIALMDPESARAVRHFRQLYDVGLHGPDIFFYRSIFLRDKASKIARDIHGESGTDFFTRVCKHLRLEPTEAAAAYLCGVLAHYCLDSVVHPFVLAQTADGKIRHAELETEFDRFLLQRDGKRQPNTYDCSGHIRLTPGECAAAARFYPEASASMVSLSVKGMARWVKVLAMPNGNLRRIVESGAGEKLRQHFMGRTPNKNCAHLDEQMQALYDQALAQFPRMLDTLQAHMHHNAPLDALFEPTFNG